MMKILIYSNGRPASVKALQFAARLARPLHAELAVITIRSETHAIEPSPPLGCLTTLSDASQLPPGLQVLAHARNVLADEGLLDSNDSVQIRTTAHGSMFTCQTTDGRRIPFHVCFGHMVETINHEIDRHHYDLLVVAPPRRGRLGKMMLGDTTRKLILNVHTSVLIVRNGQADHRFIVCADGSVAAKRQFPMLKHLLPAIPPPLEFAFVQTPTADEATLKTATHCLHDAEQWASGCDKAVKIHHLQGDNPAKVIATLAGDDAVIIVGGSLRHDLYRRLRGSLAIQLLARTNASTLVVKSLPEDYPGDYQDADSCHEIFS